MEIAHVEIPTLNTLFGDEDIQRGPDIAVQNIQVSVLGKEALPLHLVPNTMGATGANMPCAQYVIGTCGSRPRRIRFRQYQPSQAGKLCSFIRTTNSVWEKNAERA